MSDVLGDALQRLLAEPGATPVTCKKPPVMLAEPSGCCAGGSELKQLSDSGLKSRLPVEPTQAPVISEVESSASEVPVRVSAQRGFHPATQYAIAVRFVLEHRRQTAAAVVLLCMTCLWFDRSSGPDSATAIVEDPGLPDVEAMLSEFDAVSALPLREPAEPIETSGDGSVPLTIPQDGIEQPGIAAEFSQYAASFAADAVYPDDAAAKSSTVGSQQTPTTPGKVRFTGNIQPLK